MVEKRKFEKLPKGWIVLGKNLDRLVYIQAISRAIFETGSCHIRVYLSSVDEKGFPIAGKLPSIIRMINREIIFVSLSTDGGFLEVEVK